MPRGNGTGSGGGKGMGQGRGLGQPGGGRGRMGGPAAGGPGGECVCTACGKRAPHQRGVESYGVGEAVIAGEDNQG